MGNLLRALLLGALVWILTEVAMWQFGRSGKHKRRGRLSPPQPDLSGPGAEPGPDNLPGRPRFLSTRARAFPFMIGLGTVVLASSLALPDQAPDPTPDQANPTTSAPSPNGGTSLVPATDLPSATTQRRLEAAVTIRGVFGKDSSASGFAHIAAASFNTVIVTADTATLDAAHDMGLQAVVWLGEYDRTATCQFEFSDSDVTRAIEAIRGHPAITAYFLADEPSIARAESCPSAPDDLRRRSELVHSLDPSAPTMVTLTTWDGQEAFPYRYWVGTADIFGLVVYPCFQGTCDFSMIDDAVTEASAAGLGSYWAVIQDFADTWYDLPDPEEVEEQFARWSTSEMTGYLVFAARGFACCVPSDFEDNPNKLAVLAGWNRS